MEIHTMSMAKRNEGAKVNSDINVTPMVDVMLVLLIIFMVITPMLQKGISVDMPKVNNPTPMADADKEDALLVSVMRDGTSISAPIRSPVDSLTGKVKDRLANRTDKRVYVKADARAHYGNVVQVVDAYVPPAWTIWVCLPTREKALQALHPPLRRPGNDVSEIGGDRL